MTRAWSREGALVAVERGAVQRARGVEAGAADRLHAAEVEERDRAVGAGRSSCPGAGRR